MIIKFSIFVITKLIRSKLEKIEIPLNLDIDISIDVLSRSIELIISFKDSGSFALFFISLVSTLIRSTSSLLNLYLLFEALLILISYK